MNNTNLTQMYIRRPAIAVAVLLVFISLCERFTFLYYVVIPAGFALALYCMSLRRKGALLVFLLCVVLFVYPFLHRKISLSLVSERIPEPDIAGYTISVDDSIALSDGIVVIGSVSKNGSQPFTCAIVTDGRAALQTGERVRFFGKVELLDAAENLPLDEEFFYSRGCYTFCRPFDYTVLEMGRFTPDTLREKYAFFIDEVSSKYLASERADGYTKALLCGDRSGITKIVSENFRITGLAPYLAVSGVHLTTVVLFIGALFSFLRAPMKASAFAAIVLCILFAYVTGEKNSCIRAAVMFIILSLGRLLGEKNDTYTALAVAFIFLWFMNPLCTFDVGTQLSFVATLAVLLAGEVSGIFEGRFPPFVVKYLVSPSFISLFAVAFTAPFTIYHFDGVPSGAVLSSIIVQPVFLPIMLLLFLLVVSDFVGFSVVCSIISKLLMLLFGIFDETATVFAEGYVGYIGGGSIPQGFTAIFIAVFSVVSLFLLHSLARGERERSGKLSFILTGVSVFFLALALFTFPSQ